MKTPSIDEYIAGESQQFTESRLLHLPKILAGLSRRVEPADPGRHPRLKAQAEAIVFLLTRNQRQLLQDPAFRELTVAAFYITKGYDAIPDVLPGIGLDDDASITDRVFVRNREVITQELIRNHFPKDLIPSLFP